jgi:hypothetical protein
LKVLVSFDDVPDSSEVSEDLFLPICPGAK